MLSPSMTVIGIRSLRSFLIRLAGTLTLASILAPLAQAVQRVEAMTGTPSLVFIERPTKVRFTAKVAPDTMLLGDSVRLVRVQEGGQPLEVVATMVDTGTNGDTTAGDLIFTAEIDVRATTQGVLRYRASVAYRGTLRRTLSEIVIVRTDRAPFFTPSPAASLVISDGSEFPINEALVGLTRGTTFEQAVQIAAAVGGEIIGFAPTGNLYQLHVPTSSVAALDAVIAQLRTDARVELAIRNYTTRNIRPLVAANDASRSAAQNQTAFDAIRAFSAWDLLFDSGHALSPVVVGVLDRGFQAHPEFDGVAFDPGATPRPDSGWPSSSCGPASLDHGTAVAGLIGAANGGSGAFQTNGILGGVPDTSSDGSAVPFTLATRALSASPAAQISEMVAAGAKVINMSFATTRRSRLGPACDASEKDFNEYTDNWRRMFADHPDVFFVVAAGNDGGAVADSTPANINADNVLSVGATDASSDPKSAGMAPFSNRGAGVDIAAPGMSVYAPAAFASPLDDGDYGQPNGTSVAAPLVAGSIGLMLATDSTLTVKQITRILRATATPNTNVSEISGKVLNIGAAIRFLLTPVDVFLLVDTTGSFADDLASFKAGATSLVTALDDSGLNIHMGLARFDDYPVLPWGTSIDRPYQRLLDVQSIDDGTGAKPIVQAINSLFTRNGSDFPESQLAALYQAATGAGQTVTGYPAATIAANQGATFRTAPTPALTPVRIFVLWTDASFHVKNDSNSSSAPVIGYPGPSFAETINALKAKNILAVGISAGGGGRTDLVNLASGTGTLAPAGGVNCNADAAIEVASGQPIVCQISASGAGIADAILGIVIAVGSN